MQSIVDYMTPRMYVAGSVASTDKDMVTFKNTLPSLSSTPGSSNLPDSHFARGTPMH